MAAGYSDTPLWKKLVLHAGDRLLLIARPDGWAVPELPPGVVMSDEPHADPGGALAGGRGAHAADTVIVFLCDLVTAQEAIPPLAPRTFPAGAIWAAWPRRAAGHESDLTDRHIREIALPLGLVDVKVAALDADWSALRLVWRRERR